MLYDDGDRKVAMSNTIKFRDTALLADMINYFVKGSQIVSFKDNSFNVYPYSDEKAYELKQELFSYIQEILESEKELKRENRFLNRRNENLSNKNKMLQENLKKSRDRNKEILNSNSWKLTQPLRAPKQMTKRIR